MRKIIIRGAIVVVILLAGTGVFSGIIISRRSNTEKRHCFILRKKIILKQSHTWKKR